MPTAGTRSYWRTAGVLLAVMVFGGVVGTLLTIPVLAVGGVIVRIPGVQPLLNRIFTADFDAPLMWGLLAGSWLLGIVVTYAIVAFALKGRNTENGVD
jgi:hypothetical protein